MTQNAKTQKMQMSVFVQNRKKLEMENICILHHNFWTNQNLDLFCPSKWRSEPQYEHTDGNKMVRNGPKTAIYESVSFRIRVYLCYF